MTPVLFSLILAALVTFVVGQLFLKKAMELTNSVGFGSRRFFVPFTIGISSMTVSFFLTLGLLRKFDLSYLFPFQGFSVIIISIAAAVMLREKLTLQLAIGAVLITVGITLVSLS